MQTNGSGRWRAACESSASRGGAPAISPARWRPTRSGRLYKSLIDRFPQDHDLNRHFAYSLQLAGDIFRRQGKLDDALLIYRQSLDITRPLHAKQPSNTEWLWTLAVNHERLGDILRAQGDLEGALRDYESYRASSPNCCR